MLPKSSDMTPKRTQTGTWSLTFCTASRSLFALRGPCEYSRVRNDRNASREAMILDDSSLRLVPYRHLIALEPERSGSERLFTIVDASPTCISARLFKSTSSLQSPLVEPVRHRHSLDSVFCSRLVMHLREHAGSYDGASVA